MRNDSFCGLRSPLVQRKVEREIFLWRRLAAAHEFSGPGPLLRTVTSLDLIKVGSGIFYFTGATKKRIFQHIFMEDHDSRVISQDCVSTKVKAVIVSDVIYGCVVSLHSLERCGMLLIIKNLSDRQVLPLRLEAVDKEIDIGMRRKIRQQLFAVIRDAA